MIIEITRLLNAHKRTVYEWLRNGLKAIDNKRPCLIHGNDLKAFINSRKQERKTKLSEGEFYCVRCRSGVIPISFTVKQKNEKQIVLKGNCPNCNGKINLFDSVKNLEKWKISLAKVEPIEIRSPKKMKKKKPTEQIRLWDCFNDSINSNLEDEE